MDKGENSFPEHSSSMANSICLNMCFQFLYVCCGLERETRYYTTEYTEKSPAPAPRGQ